MVVVRSENDQQPAFVIIIGGKDVGHGVGRQVALGVDLDRLALDADLPLQGGADVVGAVLETQSEDLGDRTPDHLLGAQPGELEGAPSAIDDPPRPVAGEERRRRRRVVVVEQLEQIGEAALLTAARLASETRRCGRCPSTDGRSGGR